jgi:hypothetical protein
MSEGLAWGGGSVVIENSLDEANGRFVREYMGHRIHTVAPVFHPPSMISHE